MFTPQFLDDIILKSENTSMSFLKKGESFYEIYDENIFYIPELPSMYFVAGGRPLDELTQSLWDEDLRYSYYSVLPHEGYLVEVFMPIVGEEDGDTLIIPFQDFYLDEDETKDKVLNFHNWDDALLGQFFNYFDYKSQEDLLSFDGKYYSYYQDAEPLEIHFEKEYQAALDNGLIGDKNEYFETRDYT